MPNNPVRQTVMLMRNREVAHPFFGMRPAFAAAPGAEVGHEKSFVCFPSCVAHAAEDSLAPASNATAPHTPLTAASSQADRRNPSAGTMTNVVASIPTTAPSVLDA